MPGPAAIREGRPSPVGFWWLLFLLAGPLLLSGAAEAADPAPATAAVATGASAVEPPETVFDLDTLKALALKDNPGVAAAMDRVRAARSRILEAQAAYYPTVAYTAAASRNHDFTPTTREERDYRQYQHGPAASWVLFDGFLRQFDTQRLKYLALGQEAQEEDARRVLLTSVASGFYLAMQASASRRIAREAAEVNRSLLDISQKQLAAGVAMDVDRMNFQVRLANAELDTAAADLRFEIAAAALRELLGAHAPPSEAYRFPDDDPTVEETLLDPGTALTEALRARPDLRAAARRVDAAQAAVKASRAAYWPTLAVQGALQYESQSAFSLDPDSQTWLVGAGLSWALFDGGLRSSRVQAAQAEADAAAHELESLRRAAAREIEESQVTIRALLRNLALHRETVSLSRQIQKLTRQRYEMGLESIARLNQALNDATDAERSQSDTRAALAIAIENLHAAVGSLPGSRP